jgi:nucleotide-binding universal stress UspA family protein
MTWILLTLLVLCVALAVASLRRRRRRGRTLGPLTDVQTGLRDELRRDVMTLAGLGERHAFRPQALAAAARYVEQAFAPLRVEHQRFEVAGVSVANLIVEFPGSTRADEIVVIGAHYDTVPGTPGADDNASGVAGLLALARRFAGSHPQRTLRFVAFVNEEPPWFKSEQMGSWQYASRCHERGERIVAMLCLEMLGYYDARRGTQRYPAPLSALFPDSGDFIAFVGNRSSRALIQRCVRAYRRVSSVPVESAALPHQIEAASWSDQWSFWQFGWPAFMVTDTALFRNPHYHEETDTPDTLDYERMARVVEGLGEVVRSLVDS